MSPARLVVVIEDELGRSETEASAVQILDDLKQRKATFLQLLESAQLARPWITVRGMRLRLDARGGVDARYCEVSRVWLNGERWCVEVLRLACAETFEFPEGAENFADSRLTQFGWSLLTAQVTP